MQKHRHIYLLRCGRRPPSKRRQTDKDRWHAQAHRRNLQTDVDPPLKIYDTATNTSGWKTPQEDAASQRGVDHLSGALRGLPKAPRRTSAQSRSAPGLEAAVTTSAPFRKTPYYTYHGAPKKQRPLRGFLRLRHKPCVSCGDAETPSPPPPHTPPRKPETNPQTQKQRFPHP